MTDDKLQNAPYEPPFHKIGNDMEEDPIVAQKKPRLIFPDSDSDLSEGQQTNENDMDSSDQSSADVDIEAVAKAVR